MTVVIHAECDVCHSRHTLRSTDGRHDLRCLAVGAHVVGHVCATCESRVLDYARRGAEQARAREE